jgi:hypothetical protein
MANTLQLGNGKWATGKDTVLAFNDENNNFKPLPFSFSRASSATVVNQSGLIETVGSKTPRIDFLGNTKGALKLEPQRTNLVTYSEDFSQSVWSTWQSTKTLLNNINPKGTNGYYEISHTGSSSDNPNTRLTNVSLNGSYTLSCFVKINQSRYISLSIEDYDGDRARVYFDTINKTFTTISNVGSPITNTSYSEFSNDWIRISLSVNLLNAVYNEVGIGIYNPSGSFPSASGEVISVFGSQLEQGSYATSYIPTSGQSGGVTRLRDLSDTQNLSHVIGQTEGVIFYDAILVHKSTSTAEDLFELSIDDGSANNAFFINNYNNTLSVILKSGGSTSFSNNSFNPTEGARYKLGFAYKQNDFALYINGNQIATDSSGTVPTMNQITFGNYYNNQLNLADSVKINDFKLYNTRLSNSELAALTS